MMEYKILEASELKVLENFVNEDIAWGWVPQGGLIVSPSGYAQAMVRE